MIFSSEVLVLVWVFLHSDYIFYICEMEITKTDIGDLFDAWDAPGGEDDFVFWDAFVRARWPSGITCPFCGSTKYYVVNSVFKCANNLCYKKFSITSKTVLENNKLPLFVIFAHINELLHAEKTVSSVYASKILACTQKTSYYLLKKLRPYCIGSAFYLTDFLNQE